MRAQGAGRVRARRRQSARGRPGRAENAQKVVNITPDEVQRCTARALERRAALLADVDTTALRLFHGAGDGVAGLVIERLGRALICQLHEGVLAVSEAALRGGILWLAERCAAQAVYLKHFPRERSGALERLAPELTDPQPWHGAATAPEFAIRENSLQFLVRPYDGYSTGLFLEHRDNRARVRQYATERRVLNTFAYTCGFTVAAAAGGARETVSVDISRKFLNWGRQNLAANGVAGEQHTFVCADTLDYLQRARKHDHRFDVIILDPPTFARTRRPQRTFRISADLDRLVRAAVAVLAPEGRVLLATNHRGTTAEHLMQRMESAARAATRTCRQIERLPLPADFPNDPEYAKSVWVQLDLNAP